MKLEAEDYLISEEKLNAVILRPGLVWHPREREWSLPFKIATDFGYHLGNQLKNVLPKDDKLN